MSDRTALNLQTAGVAETFQAAEQSDIDDRAAAIEELGKAWRETSAAHRRLRGRDAKQPGELSAPQYNLLHPLLAHGALPSGELARAVGVTPATATHMLEQLATAGYVTRVRSEADRRVVITGLTEMGRERLERKDAALQESWEDTIKDLDTEALRHAAAVLNRMTRYVDAN